MATFQFMNQNVIFFTQNRSVLSPSSSSTTTTTITRFSVYSAFSPLPPEKSVSQNPKLLEKKALNYASTLKLLKSHGFNDTQIAEMARKFPSLATQPYNAEQNLKPKLEYLVQSGFSGSLLHDLISSNPAILGRSLSNRIKPSLEFLFKFLGTEERVQKALKRCPRLLTNDLKATLEPTIDLLLEEGVAVETIANTLLTHAKSMQPSVDRLVSALRIVKHELGLDPSAPPFLLAVLIVASLGVPLWEKKVEVFMSFGFSKDEVLAFFKRYPQCFSRSEERLRSSLGFYFDTVKLEKGDVMSYPQLLAYAIDKRIRPRYNVLKILLSKKLIKNNIKIARQFQISEKIFYEKHVAKHLHKIPTLLEVYNDHETGKEELKTEHVNGDVIKSSKLKPVGTTLKKLDLKIKSRVFIFQNKVPKYWVDPK